MVISCVSLDDSITGLQVYTVGLWWIILTLDPRGGGGGGGGGALRVKISRGARLEVQNGTQQDLNEIIDLVNFGGKKIVYMMKMGGFEMGPNN